jgi:hypothetical protein
MVAVAAQYRNDPRKNSDKPKQQVFLDFLHDAHRPSLQVPFFFSQTRGFNALVGYRSSRMSLTTTTTTKRQSTGCNTPDATPWDLAWSQASATSAANIHTTLGGGAK